MEGQLLSHLNASQLEERIAREANDLSLDVVQVDGLVVLKIIKHCQDNLPEGVTGQLLGLDVDTTLEVTNCFPFPARYEGDQEEETDEVGAEYQRDMMRCLREVNVDNNAVGWYTSTYLGSFLSEGMIETQYNYQATIKKCVVLVFDPLKTSQGLLSLEAYRLTQPFMELYKQQSPNKSFTKESFEEAGLSFSDIFEQIPIKIHNSHLISALLYDMKDSDVTSAHFERLNLSTNPFLEKTLEFLTECLDDLATEQNKYQYYQKNLQRQHNYLKKKAEGEEEEEAQTSKHIQQPNRLESLLITNQINNYCEQINTFVGTGFAKMFLYGSMQK
jgi:translation initiation factor 3 subunit H